MEIGSRKRGHGGFALPVAVLALVVVGTLVTGGFYMAQQETRIGVASQNGTMAFYIAEQGMNEVLANWSAAAYSKIPLWGQDTVSGTIPQGDYDVIIHHLTTETYFLESRGTVTQGGLLSGATRRMGLLTKIGTAWIDPPAALTTRGLTRVGGTATVNGLDSVPPAWATDCASNVNGNKPGVMTDSDGVTTKIGSGKIFGAPDTLRNHSIADSTFLDYGDLGWEDLLGYAQADGKDVTNLGGTLSDIVPSAVGGVCRTSLASNWGEPYRSTAQTGYVAACEDYFPLVYHEGPLRLQGTSRGQGILLVGEIVYNSDGSIHSMTGDLDMRGTAAFSGIIIVLGKFSTQSGTPKIYGGVLAANADLNREDIIGGSTVQYSSCSIRAAILNNASLAKARPFEQRGWVDLSNVGG